MIMSNEEMDEQIELQRQLSEDMVDELYDYVMDDEPDALNPQDDCEDVKYMVVREKGNVIVSIMFNRSNRKYQFVNLTKGHICACTFDTVEDAVADMEHLKSQGEIIDYVKM